MRGIRLSKENADRMAQGLPPTGLRGRVGVWIPDVTDKPPLVDIPLHRWHSEEVESQRVQTLIRGEWWEKLLCHLPMEGGSGKAGMIRSAKMKRHGARGGTPDYILAIAQDHIDGERHGALWIELKAADGKPSQDQLDFIARVRGAGHAACVAYTADAVMSAIRVYLRGEWPS